MSQLRCDGSHTWTEVWGSHTRHVSSRFKTSLRGGSCALKGPSALFVISLPDCSLAMLTRVQWHAKCLIGFLNRGIVGCKAALYLNSAFLQMPDLLNSISEEVFCLEYNYSIWRSQPINTAPPILLNTETLPLCFSICHQLFFSTLKPELLMEPCLQLHILLKFLSPLKQAIGPMRILWRERKSLRLRN